MADNEENIDDRTVLQVLAAPLVSTYRFMRSMRTALILLLILTIASIVGTFVPQEAQQQQAVFAWRTNSPNVAAFLDFLSLFDVYGSWWFQVIVLLLITSLLCCVLPRTKAYIKKLGTPPVEMEVSLLDSLQNSVRLDSKLKPDVVLERANNALSAKGYRMHQVAPDSGQLLGRKGRWGELGSLFFHYSIIVIIVAATIGKLNGFEGAAYIVEGDRWVEQHLSYDTLAEGKVWAGKDPHRGFELGVKDFEATYWGPERGYMPKDFVSTVTVFDDGKQVKSKRINVNGKLIYKDIKFYQSSYGWAPHLRIVDTKKKGETAADKKYGGEVLYDKPTVFFGEAAQAQGQFTIPENPDPSDPSQLFIEAIFAPDLNPGTSQPQSPLLRNPATIITIRKGPQQALVAREVLTGTADSVNIGDYKVYMPEIKEWTGLQVNSDPGVIYIYVAFGFMVIGIMIALYLTHRRVWVMTVPGISGKGAQLLLAGVADKNKAVFMIEFEGLVDEVADAIEATDKPVPAQSLEEA